MSEQDYRKEHEQRKQQVMELLQSAQNIYTNIEGEKKLVDVFTTLEKNVEDGEFSIVLVGEFSAGKSSLLNALMGENLLPSFSGETTATVNFLRHVSRAPEQVRGVVHYSDGTSETISQLDKKSIEAYVTTRGNDVAHRISKMDLYLDSDYLKDNITLVDSPGFNGTRDDLDSITKRQILESHASIFVFDGSQPGSKTEFELLNELKSKVSTIFVVLNKIDLIKKSEGETPELIVENLKETYKRLYPNEETVPEIWPVAAMPALVARSSNPIEYNQRMNFNEEEKQRLEEMSKLPAFEERLMKFLTQGEKTKKALQTPVERVIKTTFETMKRLDSEIVILSGKGDMQELQEKIEEVSNQISELKENEEQKRSGIQVSVQAAADSVQENVMNQLQKFVEKVDRDVRDVDDISELKEIAENYSTRFNKKVIALMEDADDEFRQKILAELANVYQDELSKIESSVNAGHIELKKVQIDAEVIIPELRKAGLEEMSQQERQVREQLEQIQNERKQCEANKLQARRLERKAKELQLQIRNQEARRDMLEQMKIERPNGHMEEKDVDIKRTGIFRAPLNLILGARQEKRKVMVLNPGEQERYNDELRKRQKREEECNQQIKKSMDELSRIVYSDPTDLEFSEADKQAKEEQKYAELSELQKKNQMSIQQTHSANLRKIRRVLSDFSEDEIEQLRRMINNSLKDGVANYTDMIISTVDAGLNNELEKKKAQIQRLEEQLQSSEKEKKQQLDKLNEQKAELAALNTKASEIYDELLDMETDEIQSHVL